MSLNTHCVVLLKTYSVNNFFRKFCCKDSSAIFLYSLSEMISLKNCSELLSHLKSWYIIRIFYLTVFTNGQMYLVASLVNVEGLLLFLL